MEHLIAIMDTIGTATCRSKCPDYISVLISETVLYTKATLGTPASVLVSQ